MNSKNVGFPLACCLFIVYLLKPYINDCDGQLCSYFRPNRTPDNSVWTPSQKCTKREIENKVAFSHFPFYCLPTEIYLTECTAKYLTLWTGSRVSLSPEDVPESSPEFRTSQYTWRTGVVWGCWYIHQFTVTP